jgi:hypothetical protein
MVIYLHMCWFILHTHIKSSFINFWSSHIFKIPSIWVLQNRQEWYWWKWDGKRLLWYFSMIYWQPNKVLLCVYQTQLGLFTQIIRSYSTAMWSYKYINRAAINSGGFEKIKSFSSFKVYVFTILFLKACGAL